MKNIIWLALIAFLGFAWASPATAQQRSDSAVERLLSHVFGADSDRVLAVDDERANDRKRGRIVLGERDGEVDRNRRGRTGRGEADRSERGTRTERGTTERGSRTERAERRDGRNAPWETRRRSDDDYDRNDDYDRDDDWDNDEARRDRGKDRRTQGGIFGNTSKQKKGKGPAFCRSGEGHPVHGRQWCRDKGFGLGNSGGIFGQRRDRRYPADRENRSVLEDILGRRLDD